MNPPLLLLPEEWESGWPAGEDVRWCIRRAGAKSTLGGAVVVKTGGFANELGPKDLLKVHGVCLDLLVDEYRQRVGVCPVCLREAPLGGERVAAHGSCAGVNMRPVVGHG